MEAVGRGCECAPSPEQSGRDGEERHRSRTAIRCLEARLNLPLQKGILGDDPAVENAQKRKGTRARSGGEVGKAVDGAGVGV